MPRNGSGSYSQPVPNFVAGTIIDEGAVNSWLGDLGTEIQNSIAADGQTPPTADLPMATFKHTGAGNATARNQYLTMAQAQDGAATWRGTAGGTGDAITLTTSPLTTAYTAGEIHTFIMPGTNTGAVTLNVNGLGAKNVTGLGGTAITAGSLQSGQIVTVVYATTAFRVVSHGMINGGSVGGNLTIRASAPTFTVYSTDDSAGLVSFQRAGNKRWDVQTVDAETGVGNAGRDLAFIAYDDAGASIGRAMTIYRANRQIAINTAGTASAPTLTFFGDVNTGLYQSAADEVSVTTGGTQRLSIGSTTATLTTPLVLPASDPTTANQAARKSYVDTQVATKATTPTASAGVGQWVAIGNATPAGGTWAYLSVGYNATGQVTAHAAGVAAGGTTVLSGHTIYTGFAWRIA